MRHRRTPGFLTGLIVAAAALAAPAGACRIRVAPTLEDVKFADLVVVGRIKNYRIVRDEAFRRGMLASPHLPADMGNVYSDPRQSLMPDYARFEIEVDEVLVGRTPRRLSVTWDNSTFAEPEQMAPGATSSRCAGRTRRTHLSSARAPPPSPAPIQPA